MVTSPVTATPEVTSLDQSGESATTALYCAAIGPINNDYYLPIFSRFEARNKVSASWNLAACLSTLNWMAFRNLKGAALIYLGAMLGAALMVFGVGRLLGQFSELAEVALWLVFGTATFALPGFYGNALMHADSRKKMTAALTVTRTLAEACALLNKQAASRQRFIWLALLNLVLVGVVAGAYAAFSAISSPPIQPAAVIPVTVPPPIAATVTSAPTLAATASAPSPASSEAALIPAPAASASLAPALPVSSSTSPVAAQVEPLTPTAPTLVPQVSAVATTPAVAVTTEPPAPTVSKAAHRYYINVGLFAKETNAHNAHAKLLATGLPARQQVVKTANGKTTRVRVGPFNTRPQADAAVKKIHALKLDAVVIQQ